MHLKIMGRVLMNKLTSKQLFMINRKLTGGDSHTEGTLMEKLDEIAAAPYEQNDMFFYKYRDTVSKAAKLGSTLARQKPFASCNEGTAIIATLSLLELNGIRLDGYEDDIETLASCLCSGDLESCCEWIRCYRVNGTKSPE